MEIRVGVWAWPQQNGVRTTIHRWQITDEKGSGATVPEIRKNFLDNGKWRLHYRWLSMSFYFSE
jgi:hypothetical protein